MLLYSELFMGKSAQKMHCLSIILLEQLRPYEHYMIFRV